MNRPGLRRLPLSAIATMVALTLISACGSGGGSATSQPGTGSTASATVQQSPVAQIRLAAVQGNYGYPTPFAAFRGPGKMLASETFDQLVWPDSTGKQQPWLATSWAQSSDGLTFTFTLRSGVKFQDGTPLTADDVVFSFQYVMKGGAGATAAPAPSAIASVASPSANTVVLTLKKPDPTLLDEIGGAFGVSIIPKHIWASVTDPAKFRDPTSLIGSGPYHLSQYDLTAGSYLFAANNDFFLGAPIVQKVAYLPTGTTDPLLLLQQGQLDAASVGTVALPQSQVDSLKGKYTLLSAPGEYNVALHFNPSKGFPYNNTSFRQAVAYALNRQDMLKRLVSGHGVPGSVGGLGPSNTWLDKSLPDYTFDLAKAKSLLDQIGLTDTDGNGIRNLPGGGDLHIPLLTSSTDITEAQLVGEYLGAAGLQVDIQSLDQASMDSTSTKGGYSMAVIHYGGLAGDPSSGLCGRVASGRPASFTNDQGYVNPTVNSLCDQMAVAIDPSARAQLINQLQSIINQDVPSLPLYIPDQLTFVDTNLFKAWAYTPACPPCGATNNKFMLALGKTTSGG